ncbi:MAG: 5-(carboxyamino)imidazole ribonucleotide mutase [Planctomycetes bacterium]|nr:5-(carboxyamino)imidazole ribonucleotide mutase [Planctomycetota bacterium]
MGKPAKVAVLLGSDSDYEKLSPLFEVLKEFEVVFSAQVISAHRTPEAAHAFAENAEREGYEAIICAAGLAAHLAGVIASKTILPVIGIPVAGGPLQGMDALLATVQMPPGVPVATVGIGAGANAALLAVQILARSDKKMADKLHAYKDNMAGKVAEKNKNLQAKIES